MDLVLVFLFTAIMIWKSIYTIKLIKRFAREKNKKHMYINIVLSTTYIFYFYFIYKAAKDSIRSPLEGPIWLIIIFIILCFCNLLYDFKNSKYNK